jgi:hypothetical protein
MKKKSTHLKLVKPAADPELEAAAILRPMAEGKRRLRPRPTQPAAQRQRKTATFFMMDHDILSALAIALEDPVWVIISELDRRAFTSHRNPTTLPNSIFEPLGIDRSFKHRLLRRLVKIGMVEVVSRGRQASLITWNNPARPVNPGEK